MTKKPKLNYNLRLVLYHAWCFRNQFNGEWDDYYLPNLAQALDLAFPKGIFPKELVPVEPEPKRKHNKRNNA